MRSLVKIGLICWNGLMAVWFLSAMWTSSDPANQCSGIYKDACENGRAAGLGIALMLILVVAAAGNAILGVFWLVSRPIARPCPVCGSPVLNGATACTRCGHDFWAAATPGDGRWEDDPMGGHRLRYWDGSEWTTYVSD